VWLTAGTEARRSGKGGTSGQLDRIGQRQRGKERHANRCNGLPRQRVVFDLARHIIMMVAVLRAPLALARE
jgi:hypothetical protein